MNPSASHRPRARRRHSGEFYDRDRSNDRITAMPPDRQSRWTAALQLASRRFFTREPTTVVFQTVDLVGRKKVMLWDRAFLLARSYADCVVDAVADRFSGWCRASAREQLSRPP